MPNASAFGGVAPSMRADSGYKLGGTAHHDSTMIVAARSNRDGAPEEGVPAGVWTDVDAGGGCCGCCNEPLL